MGLKDFKLHDKLSASLWYQPSSNVRAQLPPLCDSTNKRTRAAYVSLPVASKLFVSCKKCKKLTRTLCVFDNAER